MMSETKRNAATSPVTDSGKRRYRLYYSGRDDSGGDGRDRGGVIRSFDQALRLGQEFVGVDGLCRVVRIDEAGMVNDLPQVWLEPAPYLLWSGVTHSGRDISAGYA
jgi:hypothetical protein